jgi:uncharacterized protein (TIGR00255 family)
MLKSMTAYGRASVTTKAGHFILEIQSVNRKFLEISVFLPRELSQFDIEIKKWLIPYLARGQVSVKVSAFFEESLPLIVKPNLSLARQVKKAWDEIAQELKFNLDEVQLSFLTSTEGLLNYEDNQAEEETYRQILKQVFEMALKNFLKMKMQEGAVLQADIMGRLKHIRKTMAEIEQKIPDAPKRFRDKLIARLEELLPGRIENEERILREIALFTEKMNISEEVTRFFCHMAHVEELIDSSLLSVGKTLEFVLQELNREINTLGNKFPDSGRAVIEIKSELECIREQIQNIE